MGGPVGTQPSDKVKKSKKPTMTIAAVTASDRYQKGAFAPLKNTNNNPSFYLPLDSNVFHQNGELSTKSCFNLHFGKTITLSFVHFYLLTFWKIVEYQYQHLPLFLSL